MNPKIIQLILITVIVSLLGYLGYTYLSSKQMGVGEILAQIQSCSNKSGCLKESAHLIHQSSDLETILTTITSNESKPYVFQSCHEFLHYIGREEYSKIGDIAQILGSGSSTCFSGFYHGALEQYLLSRKIDFNDSTKLESLLPYICVRDQFESNKKFLECLHGLGHALMFINDGEVPLALKQCDTLSEFSNWCYSGVFMENSTSSTNKDHPSKYLKDDDLLYPCTVLEDKYLSSCYQLQGFHVVRSVKGDWAKAFAVCDTVPDKYQDKCYHAMGQSLVGFTQDLSYINKTCNQIASNTHKQNCKLGASGALGERYETPDLANEFCDLVETELKSNCLQRINN